MDDLLAGASQVLARCQVPARCYQVDEELLVTGICWEVEGLFTWLKKKTKQFLIVRVSNQEDYLQNLVGAHFVNYIIPHQPLKYRPKRSNIEVPQRNCFAR